MAITKSCGHKKGIAILIIRRWHNSHWWNCYERQKNNNTSIPIERAYDQIYFSHIGIEKTRLLAHESIYWININTDIGNAIKIALYVLIFRWHIQKIRCCHIRYQADHGNMLELTYSQQMTSIIFVPKITTARSQLWNRLKGSELIM